ncbi:hypothetical protein KI688_000251 [Linnemannia hyalina]|uniref:HbrB-like protein n=1 Tax=Linnemannia hyalina TaxID=64524 RepID=A0A9P7Y3W3_9FUNG|nr:hypothetical protein KI688_000251 [Linnemannia hyalina]
MNPGAKSFSSQGSVSASVDSLASVPGIRETTLAITPGNGNELLLAQGSPNSLNSTSASSLSSAGSLPIHQQLLQNPLGESVLGMTLRSHNVDGGLHSMSPSSRTQSRTHSRNHSSTQSSNSHHSLAMNSRTPSESNGQYSLYTHQANSTAHTLINDGGLAGAAGDLGCAGRPSANVTPQAHPTLLAGSHGSNYLTSPNDITTGGQGEAESPTGDTSSCWNSPPTRPQIPPIVSTSMTSSTGGLTSPASLSSPVQLTQPSPSSQHTQTTLIHQQSVSTLQQPQPAQKPKKEKHSFGGMSASSFLTETLPGAGMKLYPGSKRGAKSHGDMSISSGKNKKSGGSTGSGGGGPLSSINTRKHHQQQLSPGGHSLIMERTYSTSSGNISSPMTGSGHYMTSPTMSRNNHSSLDAKVMAREMSQGHATEDVWQALCIKVLTLFNGQGLTGAIEDLNELVRRCLTTRNAFTLCDEINELLKNGMLTLNAKLGDVPDEKLVSRLVEGWSFFFGTVLPYFEGVFLPLQIELKTYHARNMTRKVQVASSAASHHSGNNSMMDIGGGGGGGLTGASPRSGLVDLDRHHDDSEPENVRTMALAAFRDQVILPMVDRLDGVFAKLFVDLDASISVSDTALRMIQMTSVLTSIQSGDAQQLLMEQVYNRLKTNWKQFTRRGNRGGFIGLDKKIGGLS